MTGHAHPSGIDPLAYGLWKTGVPAPDQGLQEPDVCKAAAEKRRALENGRQAFAGSSAGRTGKRLAQRLGIV